MGNWQQQQQQQNNVFSQHNYCLQCHGRFLTVHNKINLLSLVSKEARGRIVHDQHKVIIDE